MKLEAEEQKKKKVKKVRTRAGQFGCYFGWYC
jgi:hypothetical protein